MKQINAISIDLFDHPFHVHVPFLENVKKIFQNKPEQAIEHSALKNNSKFFCRTYISGGKSKSYLSDLCAHT